MLIIMEQKNLGVGGFSWEKHFLQRVFAVVLPCNARDDEVVSDENPVVERVNDYFRGAGDGSFVGMPYDYAIRAVYDVSPSFIAIDGCAGINAAA